MSHLDTLLIHGGIQKSPHPEGAVNLPIYQSSVFESHTYSDVKYIRFNNTPNQRDLHQKMAAIEGTEAAVVGASGMAVITAALLTVLKPGDRLLAQRVLYGGTLTFLKDELVNLGIEVDFVDGNSPEEWQRALSPNTKAFYCESITNPLVEVADLRAISQFCDDHNLYSIIDNTFATPVNLLPVTLGFDLVIHSATKYLNGFSDISAGVAAGPEELISPIKAKIKQFGSPLDPNSCYLLNRGLKTLSLRMKKHNTNAMELADFLEQLEVVNKVRYPGLKSHEQHELAKDFFCGYGGMLSFVLNKSAEETDSFIKRLQFITPAPSLGGVESLVMIPARISHSMVPKEEREAVGIVDSLVRVSVGTEHIDDLKADIVEALEL